MWTWSWALRNLIAELLMPPGIFIALGLLALILFRKRLKLQKTVLASIFVLLWFTSTPFFTSCLVNVTDSFMHWPAPVVLAPLDLNKQTSPKAIVVLGGGRRKGALESSEYFHQDLSKESLERVRIAARLSKKTRLPILTSGGMPDQTSTKNYPEAQVMAWVLKEEFEQNTQWQEIKSATTAENAAFAAQILKKHGIDRIYLVTHFWHMPRAQRMFEQEGMQVVPVPHGFESIETLNPLDFYPSSSSIAKTRQIWHELIGAVWYKICY